MNDDAILVELVGVVDEIVGTVAPIWMFVASQVQLEFHRVTTMLLITHCFSLTKQRYLR